MALGWTCLPEICSISKIACSELRGGRHPPKNTTDETGRFTDIDPLFTHPHVCKCASLMECWLLHGHTHPTYPLRAQSRCKSAPLGPALPPDGRFGVGSIHSGSASILQQASFSMFDLLEDTGGEPHVHRAWDWWSDRTEGRFADETLLVHQLR